MQSYRNFIVMLHVIKRYLKYCYLNLHKFAVKTTSQNPSNGEEMSKYPHIIRARWYAEIQHAGRISIFRLILHRVLSLF